MKKIILLLTAAILLAGCPVADRDLLSGLFDAAPQSLESFLGSEGVPDPTMVGGTDLTVSAGDHSAHIALSWTEASSATGYVIYRAPAAAVAGSFDRIVGFEAVADSVWEKVGAVETGVVAWDDSKIDPYSGYSYAVKAIRLEGETLYEGAVSYVRTGWCFPNPVKVRATDKVSTKFIEVSWKTVPGAERYHIYRGEAPLKDAEGNLLNPTEPVEIEGAKYKKIGESILSVFEDESAPAGGPVKNVVYFYKVAAVRASGATDYMLSTEGSGQVLAPGAVPAPKAVNASRALSKAINVSWEKAPGAVEYVIYRAAESVENGILNDSLKVIGRTGSTSYTDTDAALAEKVHYWYSVACVNKNGDEGRKSGDFVNAGGADAEGCSFTNEGYVIETPAPVVYFLSNDAGGNGAVRILWPAVPGAESYQVSRDGSAFAAVSHVDEHFDFTVSADYAGTFQVKAINAAADGTENESEASAGVAKVDYPLNASEGAFVGSGAGLKGVINVSWKPFPAGLVTSYAISRKNTFETAFSAGTGAVDGANGSYSDQDFPEINYVKWGEELIKIRVQPGESHNDALKRAISAYYKLTITTADGTYTTGEGAGWRMFTARECLFMGKMGDHSSTNHITNQISAVYYKYGETVLGTAGSEHPAQKETDQGFYGGQVIFNPYKPPTAGEQWAEIEFKFVNTSDYPGYVMNGSNYIWKNKTSGKINNADRGQNPSLTLTLFGELQIALNERSNINKQTSAIEAGSQLQIVVKYKGSQVNDYTFTADYVALFGAGKELEVSTSNCPGGRNYTRGGETSYGHYGNSGELWLDPVDCGPGAMLWEHDSVRELKITDK